MMKRRTIAISVAALIVTFVSVLLVMLPARGPSDERKVLMVAAASADRMVVGGGDMWGPGNSPPPFEIVGTDKVREFVEHIEFTGMREPCKCGGDWLFNFYKGNELKCTFTYHHGTHLRGLWKGKDAYLTERAQTDLPAWLKQHGYSAPQELREAEGAERKK
jgi:hypothetical protein